MRRQFAIVLGVFGVCGASALAGIASTADDVTSVAAPGDATLGQFESSDEIRVWSEGRSTLNGDLAVDIDFDGLGLPKVFDEFGDLVPGTLASGMRVESYVLHWDPVGSVGSGTGASGSITFDQKILGVVLLSKDSNNGFISTFQDSDYLGSANTLYPSNNLGRGLEFAQGDPNADKISFDSPYQLSVDWVAVGSNNVDQIRVITTVVPAPGAALLGVLGMGVAAWFKRRLA